MDIVNACRLFQALTPLHLLHQKVGRHCGVVLGIHGCTIHFAQIGGTLQRVFKALICFIDTYRPLHCQSLCAGTLGGKFVGVGLTLEIFPTCIDGRTVLREPLR